LRFAVIAEDLTDCDAIAVLIKRIAEENGAPTPGVRKTGEAGCARIPKKLAAHLSMHAAAGCTAAVVANDLDRSRVTNTLNDEAVLRAKLQACLPTGCITSLICIPIEEIEAWFWSDQRVLDRVSGTPGKAKAVAEPHRVACPKEKLQKLSRGGNRKPRYGTNDNKDLARVLNLDLCAKKCPAFAQLRDFVGSLLRNDCSP
jgi:hypothetical protein